MALGAHVFPEFNTELRERFGDTIALRFQEDPTEARPNPVGVNPSQIAPGAAEGGGA